MQRRHLLCTCYQWGTLLFDGPHWDKAWRAMFNTYRRTDRQTYKKWSLNFLNTPWLVTFLFIQGSHIPNANNPPLTPMSELPIIHYCWLAVYCLHKCCFQIVTFYQSCNISCEWHEVQNIIIFPRQINSSLTCNYLFFMFYQKQYAMHFARFEIILRKSASFLKDFFFFKKDCVHCSFSFFSHWVSENTRYGIIFWSKLFSLVFNTFGCFTMQLHVITWQTKFIKSRGQQLMHWKTSKIG